MFTAASLGAISQVTRHERGGKREQQQATGRLVTESSRISAILSSEGTLGPGYEARPFHIFFLY
jgi:hypothetical protein